MREQICKMNPEKRGHDACGIGAVVDRWGRPSRRTVEDALEIVEHLEHRAGKDASGQTGDGVGILLQICHPFFVAAAKEVGLDLAQAAPRGYGVGMFFFPQDPLRRGRCQKLLEILAQREGVDLLGWRPVPVAPEILGQRARSCMPAIWQGFFRRPEEAAEDLDFDRRLYVLRRTFEQSVSDTYVASLSCRTIVYKGMFLVDQLRRFYPDLRDARYTSAIALVHSRFSTNTEPSWARAHPNRVLLHNGEINTIQGNLSRMLAREETMASPPPGGPPGEGPASAGPERVGLGHAGQHLGVSPLSWPGPAQGGDGHPPGTLEPQRRNAAGHPGHVPLLRYHDGTLGRPGGPPVL